MVCTLWYTCFGVRKWFRPVKPLPINIQEGQTVRAMAMPGQSHANRHYYQSFLSCLLHHTCRANRNKGLCVSSKCLNNPIIKIRQAQEDLFHKVIRSDDRYLPFEYLTNGKFAVLKQIRNKTKIKQSWWLVGQKIRNLMLETSQLWNMLENRRTMLGFTFVARYKIISHKGLWLNANKTTCLNQTNYFHLNL